MFVSQPPCLPRIGIPKPSNPRYLARKRRAERAGMSWFLRKNMAHPPNPREQQLSLYYFMRLNRELEEQMVRLFRQNKIVGGLYSSLCRQKQFPSGHCTRSVPATGSLP